MMLREKETLELIQKTAVEAASSVGKAHVLELPGDQFAVITQEGVSAAQPVPPKARSHKLNSIDYAIRFAQHHSRQGGPVAGLLPGPAAAAPAADAPAELPTPEPTAVVVWYGIDKIVVMLDDATRRDVASCPLEFDPTFLLLQKSHNQKYCQVEFRRLLRIDLATARRDDELLRWVSSMAFDNQSKTGATITNSKTSLGKAVLEAAMSELGECPDTITLDVCVLTDPSMRNFRQPITCAVEILANECAFRLVPLPNEINRAINDQLAAIGERLHHDLACPVFQGTP
jgi:hypothetical protein